MKISIGDNLSAETTGSPLAFTPRFHITTPAVIIAEYGDMAGRERLVGKTFGSMRWLWAETDDVHFDQESWELVGAAFYVPSQSAPSHVCRRGPDGPRMVPGGLRAASTEAFELPQATVFCCDPEAAELRCAQDPSTLDTAPDARIGIARDLALLVREGRMIGWSLTDPARYLTEGFAEPDVVPPSPATRIRLAECLEFISSPLVDEVMDQDIDAWHRLRATEHALREQREDRHRADILLRVVSRLIEDYQP